MNTTRTRDRYASSPAAYTVVALGILAVICAAVAITHGPRAGAAVAVLLLGVPIAGTVALVVICLIADRARRTRGGRDVARLTADVNGPPVTQVANDALSVFASRALPAEPQTARDSTLDRPGLDTAAASRVHYATDPRIRQLAEARWRLTTGGTRDQWLALGKDNPEALIAEARDWVRAAVAAGILPPPQRDTHMDQLYAELKANRPDLYGTPDPKDR